MRKFGLKVPSEKSARSVMAKWIDMNDVIVEMAPFATSKKDKKGEYVMKSKALAYILQVPEHLIRHLDLLDR